MDSYNQIKVTVPVCDLQLTSDVMTMMNFTGGIMIEDYSDIDACPWDYVDTEILGKDRTTASVSGFVPSSEDILPVLEQLKLLLPVNAKTEVISVEQSDWANNWKKYYKPVRVGKNIVIKPSWEQYDKKETDVIVELDPGMAFGTGTHETTRLCLLLLEKYMQIGSRVLDVGTGSGILSIAARKLGASSVFAYDIDPVAVRVARDNVEINDVSNITCGVSDLLSDIDRSAAYDFVCANIVADILIRMAPDIGAVMCKGGLIITSGIVQGKCIEVKETMERYGFTTIHTETENDWVAYVFKK